MAAVLTVLSVYWRFAHSKENVRQILIELRISRLSYIFCGTDVILTRVGSI
jgi:hypothetical protein